MWVLSLGWEDPLEKEMATTPVFMPEESSWTEEPGSLDRGAWRPRQRSLTGWTEEPGRLQSMGSQRVRHN